MMLVSHLCTLSLVVRPVGHSVASVAPRRCAVVANLFSEPWMNELGRSTNSKALWALPIENDTLGPGSVVMANPGSFDHYFLESLVLVLKHDADGTQGVLLNHETPWIVDEMSPGALEPFAANTVFLGGDAGKDTMVLVHGESLLPGATEVGRGVYQGGVAAAVEAVKQGALPPDRFKFFYKTVEWLPNALQMNLNSGVFRLVELSPAYLYGQSGQRSMWKDVRKQLAEEEAAAEAAMSAMAPTDGEAAEGEAAAGPSAPPMFPDAIAAPPPEDAPRRGGSSLAEEAKLGAARMRKQRQEVTNAKKATQAEELERARAAREAHDAKLKALVEDIKREKREAAEAERRRREAAGEAAEPEAPPEPPPMAPLPFPEAADSAPEPAAAAKEPTAAQATAWLAERGIVAPSAAERPATATEQSAAAAEPAPAPPAASSEAALWSQPAAAAKKAPMTLEELLALSEKGERMAQEAAKAEAEKAEEAEATETEADAVMGEEVSTCGIEALLAYRFHLGSEQWRVRWQGEDEDSDTWETWRVLDTDALRRRAEELKEE